MFSAGKLAVRSKFLPSRALFARLNSTKANLAPAVSESTTPRSIPLIKPQAKPHFKQAPQSIIPEKNVISKPEVDTTFVGMTGGEIFHEMMLRHDVKCVFGYPGGAILPVYDAIYNSDYFEFILPRHEQGAGHMAEGYARVTGKPGVVLVTSGPGATNMVTPMQDALSDGIPLIVFTGQVPTTAIGSDAFQEADVVGITRQCTKWNVMVKSVEELPRRINEAFEIATSGRPGPVLVDLPKDITAGILTKPIVGGFNASIPGRKPLGPNTVPSKSTFDAISRAADLINKAKKPILYVGNGILASEEGPKLLKELAHKAQIPVTTTFQGLGAFDEYDDLSLHMLGMHGSAYANLAIQSADVIVALGARFDDRVTCNLKKFAPTARRASMTGKGGIIHFELVPKQINKILPCDVAVEGDVTANISYMLPLIRSSEHEDAVDRSSWHATLAGWKEKYPFSYSPAEEGGPLKPQQVLEELNRQTEHIKDNVIISTGVGQHQMWAAQYFRWRYPRTFVSSGGLGTMGYGLPAAIGAKVGAPEKMVIDIDGDASLSMTAMELMTARQFNIGVKVLLLNNDFQGMVKQWQDLFYDKRYSATSMRNPDFVKFAESMNCVGLRVRTAEELPEIMAQFLATKEPVILDAVVDKHEHVYPMVPAGKGLHEMVLGDAKIDEPHHKFHNSYMAP
ncbi:Acetolactate synthase, mitochondrial [Nowakowskiella sp. JEL0407]|nr:Acetolactate synthase, mitochondrial [Nowakowskiella sp. JEL0407]